MLYILYIAKSEKSSTRRILQFQIGLEAKSTISVYIRDTVVQWRVPEGSDSARIPDSDTSRLETGLARSTAYVKDGELHHSLENKAGSLVPIFLSVPERARTEEKGITRTVETVEYVEVEKDFNGWQRFLMGLGWAVLGALALWVFRKVRSILSA